MDCAWARLPFMVVADELAFPEPATLVGVQNGTGKQPAAPPVAVAVALAMPPFIAVDIEVATAGPGTKPRTPPPTPPVAMATAGPPFVTLADAVAPPPLQNGIRTTGRDCGR